MKTVITVHIRNIVFTESIILQLYSYITWSLEQTCCDTWNYLTFVRETDFSRHNGGTRGSPILPRDISLSDSKSWNVGQKWVKTNLRCSFHLVRRRISYSIGQSTRLFFTSRYVISLVLQQRHRKNKLEINPEYK